MKASFSVLFLFLLSIHLSSAQTTPAADNEDNTDATDQHESWRIPITIGHYLVGGNLLFANANFQKGADADYGFGIAPKVGVFVLPGLALGLSMDLSTRGYTGYTSLDYGISPFARVYFSRSDISQKHPLRAFAEGSVGIAGANSWYDVNGQRTKTTTNGFRLGLMPGLDYFLNDHVALEGALSYQFITGTPSANQLYFGLGFQVFLGK